MSENLSCPAFVAVLFGALLSGCDSRRGEPREVQLENTAVSLEAKAEEVLEEVEVTAEAKEKQAEQVRETAGDEQAAEALDKDAETTREVGKLRAEQLEKQAEKVRDQKEE
jgi:hypothetical protein